MPEAAESTEPTVGEELSIAVEHDRHVINHDDCWRCQADDRRYRASGIETEDDD